MIPYGEPLAAGLRLQDRYLLRRMRDLISYMEYSWIPGPVAVDLRLCFPLLPHRTPGRETGCVLVSYAFTASEMFA